jgi:hypothetical protein
MTRLHRDYFESRCRVCRQFLAQNAHPFAPLYAALLNAVIPRFISVD